MAGRKKGGKKAAMKKSGARRGVIGFLTARGIPEKNKEC